MTTNLEHIALWRALMQLSQVTESVLVDEVAREVGLPESGLTILRLLQWGGPQSEQEIAAHLSPDPAACAATYDQLVAQKTFERLVEEKLVSRNDTQDDFSTSVLQITDAGIGVAHRTVERQRTLLWEALGHVEERYRPVLTRLLQQLTRGLTSRSGEFDVMCADCWAYEEKECVRPQSLAHCPFRQMGRARTSSMPIADSA